MNQHLLSTRSFSRGSLADGIRRRARGRQVAAAIAASGLTAALLAGCSSAAGSSTTSGVTSPSGGLAAGGRSLSGVTLRVGDQVHLQETLLSASGQLAHLPYKIAWSEFTSGPPLLAALSSGHLDLGGVGDAPPVFAAAAQESIKLVAATYSGGDRNDAIVVPPGSKLTSVQQLKGKRVAVAEGTSGNEALLAALQHAGLTWKDITPVYLQPPDALAALRSGSIDAWAVWYPYVALATAQGGKVIESAKTLDPGYGFVVSSPSTLSDSNKAAAVADFLRRLHAAQQWADSHGSVWAGDFSRLTGVPAAVATATAQQSSGEQYIPITSTVVQAEQAVADNFAKIGLIKSVHVSTIVDQRYSKELGG